MNQNIDALIDMLTIQRNFYEQHKHRYPEDIRELHLAFCAHLMSEVTELMDCIPWKSHRLMKGKSRAELLEELIDVLKLWLNLVIAHHFTVEDVITEFRRKSEIVAYRAAKESTNA